MFNIKPMCHIIELINLSFLIIEQMIRILQTLILKILIFHQCGWESRAPDMEVSYEYIE